MKIGEIITYRGRKYEVCKLTRKRIHNGVIRRAYLKPYGFDGENRVGIIEHKEIKTLEKRKDRTTGKEFYRTWS